VERDDHHDWSAAIRSTGGLVWEALGSDEAKPAAAQVAAYEEWARPRQLDHARLFSADLAVGAGLVPETLHEGDSYTHADLVDRELRSIRLEGELWSRPVAHELAPDAQKTKLWSALVFGTEHLYDLTDAEMMTLAMQGGAVSPVTSYLAIEPGVRPSTEGLEAREAGSHRTRAPKVRMGATMVSGRAPWIDVKAWLHDQLGLAWSHCGGAPNTASVDFETTYAEVVSVERVTQVVSDPLLERCLTEAVYSLVLPVQFEHERATWSVPV
jgi:hypothetical protein